ncbi:peptidase M24, structural domain-containing protein [Pilobolus umbonatus]|nr:peptidase M24, structural domain-containing protein [Pilobolus umbonatus]
MTPHSQDMVHRRHSKPIIPTKQHCLKVKRLMNIPQKNKRSIIYMKGKGESTRDDTDIELEFRQESYFFYLTGVDEPGFQVIIHLQKEKVYLIAPTISNTDIAWKGPLYTDSELLEKYDVDEIILDEDMPRLLKAICPDTIYTLNKKQADHIRYMANPDQSICTDSHLLTPAMNEARLIKFSWEIDIIRQVMHGSSMAHVAIMQQFQPGMTEAHLAALFRWSCALNNVHRQAYLPIVASGPRAATLHYVKNNRNIPTGPHSLVLVDAGGENLCYGSDITRTFPVCGIFSEEAKTIYDIVLKTQETVLSRLKPGVYWSDMQQLAIEILCQELMNIGILVADDINILIELGVPFAFYYHGLGHTVGLDVHDVGGQELLEDDDDDPTISHFLLHRPLEQNMVLTVEPGLYFNDTMLNIWTQYPGYQQFFDMKILSRYRGVGGVRIEDTVVITEQGYENMTKVPKHTHEIEALMDRDNRQYSSHYTPALSI